MARPSNELKQLREENKRLQAENEKLKQQKSAGVKSRGRGGWKSLLRTTGAGFFLAFAAALLLTGNVIFWTGNTIVKNDRFNTATQPIIRNPQVQQAVAAYTTQQIYSNVDVSQYIANVLPPRADFLAPTIASQLQTHTNSALQKVLANPQFQDRWNKALANSHARFINTVSKYGGDGVIDLNELYQELSASLQGTKLSFLANKQLPSSVGSIQVISGPEITILHNVANNIDTWRILTVILFVASAAAGIWLSIRRRRAVISLGLLLAAMMFITLVGLRLVREIVAGKVNPSYANAVRETIQIIFHPLVIQTVTLMAVALVISAVAWLSGPSKSATAVKSRTSDLLAGRLHTALFGGRENGLTLWLGRYKRQIQWSLVALVAIIDLLVRLTPAVLISSLLLLVAAILAVETLAAPAPQRRS